MSATATKSRRSGRTNQQTPEDSEKLRECLAQWQALCSLMLTRMAAVAYGMRDELSSNPDSPLHKFCESEYLLDDLIEHAEEARLLIQTSFTNLLPPAAVPKDVLTDPLECLSLR